MIFQILFLFFAAVINIGLLVHHKINLQNSVDLAAYYGASKQAEKMLNAISHVNYQIRQSWKLLSWRYRVLGTSGSYNEHPLTKPYPYNPRLVPTGVENLDDIPTTNGVKHNELGYTFRNLYRRPAFCITFVPFKPVPPDENTCKNMSSLSNTVLNLFPPTTLTPYLFGISSALRNASITALQSIGRRAEEFGTFNYLTLGRFYLSYITDITAKKLTISALAQGLSLSDEDFFDLDGDKVMLGVSNTLKNNLTFANKESLQTFKLYNSLGPSNSDCGVSVGQLKLPEFVKEIRVIPGFEYADTTVSNPLLPTKVETASKPLFNVSNSGNLPTHYLDTQFVTAVQAIQPFMGILPQPKRSFVGI